MGNRLRKIETILKGVMKNNFKKGLFIMKPLPGLRTSNRASFRGKALPSQVNKREEGAVTKTRGAVCEGLPDRRTQPASGHVGGGGARGINSLTSPFSFLSPASALLLLTLTKAEGKGAC